MQMPHVIVKLWPGKSKKQKQELADKITRAVMQTLHYGEESISVGAEEVPANEWMSRVYEPDIQAKPDTIFKKPGYEAV
jgi:4-oxalocrotonate tautomerase